MGYVLILQMVLGTDIETIYKQFDEAYPCYLAEYEIKTMGLPATPQLKQYEGYEVIPRCYKK